MPGEEEVYLPYITPLASSEPMYWEIVGHGEESLQGGNGPFGGWEIGGVGGIPNQVLFSPLCATGV